ncbi:MAG: hypothetical protein AAF490_24530, partial [Chloroflexota bacterium]
MAERIATSRQGLVRPMLWLRGKLTIRQFTRERGRIIGAVFAFLIFGPMIAGATWGTAIAYRNLPEHLNTGLLGGIFVLLWFVWLVFPIVFSSMNEAMDISRLLMYPLTRRDMILGTLLGTVFDYPTFLILPLFGAMIYGFGFNLPVLIAILLGYAHAVIIGQLILTVLGGVVQSRRFRDISIIFFSLLGGSCYFLQQGFISLVERFGADLSQEAVLALRPLSVLQWFPTGALARFVEQAQLGNWSAALLWLSYSTLFLGLFTTIWVSGLYRLATGQGFLFNAKPKPEKELSKPKTNRDFSGQIRGLPEDISVIFIKEMRLNWRNPQRRVALLQGLVFPVFMGTGLIFGTGDEISWNNLPDFASLTLAPYALFTFWATCQNMLAWEGHGLASFLLMPIPRKRIFLGKSLALFIAASVPYLVVGITLLIFLPSLLALASILTGLAMGIVTLAVTAVSSVLFPIRVNVEVKQSRSSFQ